MLLLGTLVNRLNPALTDSVVAKCAMWTMRLPLPSPSIYLKLPGLPGSRALLGREEVDKMAAPTKQIVQTPSNKMQGIVIAARVFTSAPTGRLYEAVRDVRGFPRWAPGVRRVEVIRGLGEQGMLSEWEVSFLGLRKKIWSVLEEAVPQTFLHWSYDGPIRGWGECKLRSSGGGWTLAEFRTELELKDAWLRSLVHSASVKEATQGHLRRSLVRLGGLISGDGGRFVVGPLDLSS
jgi:hypothetical protein